MRSIIIEIVFLAIVLVLLILMIAYKKRFPHQYTNVYIGLIMCMIMIEIFLVIHFLFCYQIGLPASLTQDNDTDLNLTSSDWLSFLGAYLGFAGSFIMAYVVYKQTEMINRITLSEYQPSVSIAVLSCVKSTAYEPGEFAENAIMQVMPGTDEEEFYSYHYNLDETNVNEFEDFKILIFVEIINNSKTSIKNISFKSLAIREVNSEGRYINYEKKEEGFDPADRCTDILPNHSIKRCILLNCIPEEMDIGWMTLNFVYNGNLPDHLKILVSKTKGKAVTMPNISK